MPSSFDALHEETRDLALLDDAAPRPCPRRAAWLSAAAFAVPVLMAILAL